MGEIVHLGVGAVTMKVSITRFYITIIGRKVNVMRFQWKRTILHILSVQASVRYDATMLPAAEGSATYTCQHKCSAGSIDLLLSETLCHA